MRPLFSNNQHCYYHRSLQTEVKSLPPLDRNVRTQIAIIGGGMTGLSAALHAARAGFDVTLLEGRCVANGASSVNGGIIIPNTAASADAHRALYGTEHAAPYFNMARKATDYAVSLIEESGIECDLGRGVLRPAANEQVMASLAAGALSLENEFGAEPLSILSQDEVRDIVKSTRYSGAVFNKSMPHLNPLKFTLGVAAAATAAGVQLYEGTHVASIVQQGAGVEVHTNSGHVVTADRVLLATNMDNGALYRPLSSRVVKVYAAMIGSNPLPSDFPIIHPGLPVWEKPGGAAYKRTLDGSFLFGGATLTCVNNSLARRALMKAAAKYFPQLKGVEFPHIWGGAVGAGRFFDLPDVGKVQDALYYAQRITLSWGPYFGKAFAAALQGDEADFRFRESFPKKNLPMMPLLGLMAGPVSACVGRVAAI